MSKQTAVEWLLENITISSVAQYKGLNIDSVIEHAKQMEKEQITDAYWEGGQDVPTQGKQAEQYYNETYKEDKQ